jgi:hypothetical protein
MHVFNINYFETKKHPAFKPGVFRNALGPLHFGGLSALDAFCSSLKAPKVRPHTSWLGGYS